MSADVSSVFFQQINFDLHTNIMDTDQIAPNEAVWSGSILFAV